jgi:hypothetical protein
MDAKSFQGFFFRGKGVRVLGAEPVAIDSMELLALVDLLENAPHMSTLIYVDASYILHGAYRRRLNARAWVRQSNRALWRRFDEVCAIRERVGAETILIKCSSHGKDSRQHASIDLWNGRADRMAERFRIKGPFQDEWWLRGDLDYVSSTGVSLSGGTLDYTFEIALRKLTWRLHKPLGSGASPFA